MAFKITERIAKSFGFTVAFVLDGFLAAFATGLAFANRHFGRAIVYAFVLAFCALIASAAIKIAHQARKKHV